MNIEQISWFISFGIALPAFHGKHAKKTVFIIEDEQQEKKPQWPKEFLSEAKKEELMIVVNELIPKHGCIMDVYDALKTLGIIRRSDGQFYSYNAIKRYIKRVMDLSDKNLKPQKLSKINLAIGLIKQGIKRKDVVKLLKIHPRYFDLIKRKIKNGEILLNLEEVA